MKTIYARQGLNDIIESALNESYVRFVHYLATDTLQEYYQTDSDLQVVIVTDISLDNQAWHTVESEIRNYFKLHFERFDFVKRVAVIFDNESDIVGHIKLGIDMEEYGGGDWDEPITYSPDITVIDSSNVTDEIIQDVIEFVIDSCEVEDFGNDLDYETVIGER
jgi:hypothetical protein